jgi:hypothetical protein
MPQAMSLRVWSSSFRVLCFLLFIGGRSYVVPPCNSSPSWAAPDSPSNASLFEDGIYFLQFEGMSFWEELENTVSRYIYTLCERSYAVDLA